MMYIYASNSVLFHIYNGILYILYIYVYKYTTSSLSEWEEF